MDEFKESIINSDDFAEEHGALGPIYGKQWVDWKAAKIIWPNEVEDRRSGNGGPEIKKVNQIQDVINTLKNNPDSRRIIVNAWNVGEIEDMALPPCHWAFELYTEELSDERRYNIWFNNNYSTGMERYFDPENLPDYDNDYYDPTPTRSISLKWHQRSVDTFLGLPFNIASYGLLLEMFAQQCNMVPDKLVGDLTNVHIYKNHIEQCEEQLEREPLELPKLQLDKAKDMFSYRYEDVNILNYSSHPAIKGAISV